MSSAKVLKNKRFLFLLPTLEMMGGAERQALYLADHLVREQGCKVKIWGLHNGQGFRRYLADNGYDFGVSPFRWPCRKRTYLQCLPRFAAAARKFKPDVLMGYTYAPGIAAGLVWRLTGTRTCIWNQRAAWNAHGDSLAERLALSWTPCFISNSSSGKEFLVSELGVPEAKVEILRNGCRKDRARLGRRQWRERLNIPEHRLMAVMLANFRKPKDHVGLLEAWKSVAEKLPGPKPVLVLAGSDGGDLGRVRKTAAELEVGGLVRFPGYMEDNFGLLEAADLYVHCSHEEGNPNGLIEAMLCGLPAVGSNIPGIRECLPPESWQCLAGAGQSEELAERLLMLLETPELRDKLGSDNREYAERHFSMRSMAENYMDYFARRLD